MTKKNRTPKRLNEQTTQKGYELLAEVVGNLNTQVFNELILRDPALGEPISVKLTGIKSKCFAPRAPQNRKSLGIAVDVIPDPSERWQLWSSELLLGNQV